MLTYMHEQGNQALLVGSVVVAPVGSDPPPPRDLRVCVLSGTGTFSAATTMQKH